MAEINEATLNRLTGAIETRNTQDDQMVGMWGRTLDLSETREKRLVYLIWALVVAVIFLATGHILSFVPLGV